MFAEHAPSRHAHGQNRGLGIFRQPQFVFPDRQERSAEWKSERVIGLGKRLRCNWEILGKTSPIPTVCEPCPGNRNAIFFVLMSLAF